MFYDAPETEKPFDRMADDGGFSAIFRTIACIGDSLSSGEHEGTAGDGSGLYLDYFEYSWGQFMARTIGSKVYNLSRGGMTANEYISTFADENGFWSPEYASQAYIIALGVNDVNWAYAGTLGELSDIENDPRAAGKPTFAGDMAHIIRKVREQEPKSRIFLMTIPRDPDTDPEIIRREDRHAELIRGIAEAFPFTYVLDFRKYAPVYDEAFRKRFFVGFHMNAAGYLLTAKFVMSYLDYIIRHNPEDFCQVGFIGKGGVHNGNYKW